MPRFRVYRVSSFGVRTTTPPGLMKGYSGDLQPIYISFLLYFECTCDVGAQ